jgi:hypothetical protein
MRSVNTPPIFIHVECTYSTMIFFAIWRVTPINMGAVIRYSIAVAINASIGLIPKRCSDNPKSVSPFQ